MDKNNLFTIGEIAKAIGITRRIILNYEAKGLIVPDSRDTATGNRYYSIDTFTRIRTIRIFQGLGLSLDEIKEYFDNGSALNAIIARLETMQDELNLTIEKLRERARGESGKVRVIRIDAQTIYRRTYTTPSIAEKTAILRNTALEALKKHGTDTTRRMYFTEFTEPREAEISYCVAVPSGSRGEHVEEIPELTAVSVFHHGAYEDIPKTRKFLIDYAKENNLRLTGTFRSLYLEGPPQHKDKERFITQIIAPIEK